MITNYFKKTIHYPRIWGLTLLALINMGSLLSMENPLDLNSNTTDDHNFEADNGLTLVRKYLTNRTDATTAISQTLEQQTSAFKQLHSLIAQVTPTAVLAPQCYISFEEKKEIATGIVPRKLRSINSDRKGLTEGDLISIKTLTNSTFQIITANPTNRGKNKNVISQSIYNFNEPIENLIPNKPGYHFILKGSDAPETKDCLHLLKNISKINQYVSAGQYQANDIPNEIAYPSISPNNTQQHLTTFAQSVYNQAAFLRLLHTYTQETYKDNKLSSLIKLPSDLIAKEGNLTLLQKITTQLRSDCTTLDTASPHDSPIDPALFTNMHNLLTQWTQAFNADDNASQATQKIMTQLDNWLPTVKQHRRIEDKSWDSNNKQYSNSYVPDNRYANGKLSTEPIRYNPNLWLNQCINNDISKIRGALYKDNPDHIPVINNLYINSPLMIDNFTLKHGVKTQDGNDSYCYALKGKIYILLPDGNGGWNDLQNNNTKQPFCIEKTFICAINNNLQNNTYEVFHRGHTCSNGNPNNIINQCYVQNTGAINDNWFSDNNPVDLANHVNPIISQQTETATANKFNINKYSVQTFHEGNCTYYRDIFGNYVCNLNDSSITIWMPPMQNRRWAMQIILEKPAKHNLI